MDKVLMSGIFGACAGALGFLLARKIHGAERVEKCYPPYALVFFGLFHTAFYLIQ